MLRLHIPVAARRNPSRVFWAALAACVLAVASACGSAPQGQPGAAGGGRGAGQPAAVELQTLAERPVVRSSEFVGTLRSRLSTTVQAQVEGFITRIAVKSGDRVQPGDVLFEIDAASQQAVVASLEAIRAAREADATFARQQAERAAKLLAAGAMSQQEHDQAQSQQRAAEAQLRAIDDQIRQQRNELSYARVTAARVGVVGDIPVRIGDRITKQTALTTIEDNAALELYVSVPVEDVPRLKLDLPVELVDDTGAATRTVRVSFISPSVDDATQTVLVKAVVANPGVLKADQFVRTRIVWSEAPAVTVPVVSVTRISGQYFVYVAGPGEGGGLVAHLRPVTLGPVVGNDYIVTGGVSAGDRVVVAGIQKITGDGAAIADAPPAGRGGAGSR
jgi:RND family efflux transporter MFP subunit